MKYKKDNFLNILCDDSIDLSSISSIKEETTVIEITNLLEDDILLNIDEILNSNSLKRIVI